MGYVSQLPYVWYYVGVKRSFNMLVGNASPRGPMCFRCLSCGECDIISLYSICCSVNGSVCVVCLTVFVNCLVKQFTMCLGVVAILLLNVMEVFSVG